MDWRPWMDAFLPPLLEALPGRVAFVGIQGSFGRGEAGPESDVDLVVVLDALGAAELAACRGVLEKMHFLLTVLLTSTTPLLSPVILPLPAKVLWL